MDDNSTTSVESGSSGDDDRAPVQRNTAADGGTVYAVQNGNQAIYHVLPDTSSSNPWLTAQEAFDDPHAAAYFSHRWDLVGRTELVEELVSLTADTDGATGHLGILLGAAGAGKSRVLHALAADFALRTGGVVRVLPAYEAVGHQVPARLPDDASLLVIIEDAHQRPDDLSDVIRDLCRQRPRARIIISTRPSGMAAIRTAFRQLRMDDTLVPTWELDELSSRQATSLAAQALSDETQHLARWLAMAVGDSPFLLVFSAVQIARGQLNPERLQRDGELRRQVTEAFITEALGSSVTHDEDRSLLHLVAALQPVRLDSPHFPSAMAQLLGLSTALVRTRLARLVDVGLLARRGASYRILPDLLGDVLLAEAAFDPRSGRSNGFLEDVLANTDGEPLINLLVNTGRVDWQWKDLRPNDPSPVEPLWRILKQEYAAGSTEVRRQLLTVVRKVAPFQPRRALDLLRATVEAGRLTLVGLLDAVPPVLAAIAHDPNHLGEALDLLWEVGQQDGRPIHSAPYSALRLLSDLASYTPDKPLFYQEAVVDAVGRWVQAGPVDASSRMPFALLDQIFETVAEHHETEGWTVVISRLPLAADRVASVRARAYQVLLDAYSSSDPVRAGVAARSLGEAFRDQRGSFEDLVVEALEELAARTQVVGPDPLVSLAVHRSVLWHMVYGAASTSEAARRVSDSLPDSLPHRIAVLMHSDCHEWQLVDDDYDFVASERAWQARIAEAAEEATSLWDDGTVGNVLCDLLEKGIQVFAEYPSGCSHLIGRFAAGRPGISMAVVRGALERGDNTVDIVVAPALKALWDSSPFIAEQLLTELEGTDRPAVLRSVLQASAARVAAGDSLSASESTAVGRLAGHDDASVRVAVLRLAVRMVRNPSMKSDGIALLCSIQFSALHSGAKEFAWAFVGPDAISWSDMTPDQRAGCVIELIRVQTLDDHRIQSAIAALSEAYENEALDIPIQRLESWESDPVSSYIPLPFSWKASLPFRNSSRRTSLLERLIHWFEQEREHPWRREIFGVKLFNIVAGETYNREVLDVILKAFRSGDSKQIWAIAPLLSGVHRGLLWDEPDFVADVLQTAARQSNELYRRVGDYLMSAGMSGLKSTSPGEPFPQDVEVREQASRIRRRLTTGSPEDRFYSALQERANVEIEGALREDQNFDNRREW
ncbi:ATP-binding protein [Streptomyces vinaceus]|uniref:ATP-binding protein n=1 Tax=Streptomyces vinaceus TaxID=1960 RepID=UPI003825C42B